MRTALMVTAIALLLAAPAAAEFQNEPEGFRGIEWGTWAEGLEYLSPVGKTELLELYVRDDDVMTLGAAKLTEVRYGFFKGRFVAGIARVEGEEDGRALMHYARIRYGRPMKIDERGEHWAGERTMVTYKYYEDRGFGVLFVGSTAFNRALEKAKAQAQKQKQEQAEKPEAEKPVTEKPVTEKPVTEKPVTEKPVTEKPVTEKPVTEKPVTEKPVTEKPVTEKPVTEEPVAERPVTERPVIKEKVIEEEVAEEEITDTAKAGPPPAPKAPPKPQPMLKPPVVDRELSAAAANIKIIGVDMQRMTAITARLVVQVENTGEADVRGIRFRVAYYDASGKKVDTVTLTDYDIVHAGQTRPLELKDVVMPEVKRAAIAVYDARFDSDWNKTVKDW